MDEPEINTIGRKPTIVGDYERLSAERQVYQYAAVESAQVTIPSLFPTASQDHRETKIQLESPWDGLGARCVNQLASKLLMALFPPGIPFAALFPREDRIQAAAEEMQIDPAEFKAEVNLGAVSYMKQVMSRVDEADLRPAMWQALRQLIVAGNSLLYVPATGRPKAFPLNRYVVKRDASDHLLEAIVKETVAIAALDPMVRSEISKEQPDPSANDAEVDVYTRIRWDRQTKRCHGYQVIRGRVIDGTRFDTPIDAAPYIVQRWTAMTGEPYGRGYVEDQIGDWRALNALTRSVVTGALETAKVHWLIRPGSTLRPKDFRKDSGAVDYGNAGDVTSIRSDKGGDFQVAYQAHGAIVERLSAAYLLARPRTAERVTAEEIRLLSGELEDALGGTYALLAGDLQRPLVRRYMAILRREEPTLTFDESAFTLKIVTGLSALGRNHELQALDSFSASTQQLLGPDVFTQHVNVSALLKLRAAALGIDGDLIRSAEEVQEIEEQRNQQALAQQAAGPAVNQAGQLAGQALAQQSQPPVA